MSLGLQYKNQEHIFDEKTVDGVPFLSYPMLEETGIVHHGFSTKLGGVSKGCWATMNISTTRGDDPEDVEENQRRIARAIGVKPEDMTFYGNGRNDHKCTGNLSGDILCGLRTTVFCRSCEKSDRTVAFGLERNGWKDRKSNSGTDAKNIWFGF